MAAIHRRSAMCAISPWVTLATADDVNGVQDLTQSYDVTGALRVIVASLVATAGTLGIDVACISHDGGKTWTADGTTGLLMSADDSTGTVLVNGVLEAAGIDPVGLTDGVFKFGPYEGPTAFRIFRVATAVDPLAPSNSLAWATGAPVVLMCTVGKGPAAPAALA